MKRNNKQIPIRCKGNRYLPYDRLKTFQGDLKEMTEANARKLKASILKYGWVAPIFAWNKNEILDGHGRLLVLGELLRVQYGGRTFERKGSTRPLALGMGIVMSPHESFTVLCFQPFLRPIEPCALS